MCASLYRRVRTCVGLRSSAGALQRISIDALSKQQRNRTEGMQWYLKVLNFEQSVDLPVTKDVNFQEKCPLKRRSSSIKGPV